MTQLSELAQISNCHFPPRVPLLAVQYIREVSVRLDKTFSNFPAAEKGKENNEIWSELKADKIVVRNTFFIVIHCKFPDLQRCDNLRYSSGARALRRWKTRFPSRYRGNVAFVERSAHTMSRSLFESASRVQRMRDAPATSARPPQILTPQMQVYTCTRAFLLATIPRAFLSKHTTSLSIDLIVLMYFNGAKHEFQS